MIRPEQDRLNSVQFFRPAAQDAHYRVCAKTPAPMVQHPPMAELIAKRPVKR